MPNLPQAKLQHESLATQLSSDTDYRVLRRLSVPNHYADPASKEHSELKTGLVVDVETTGFSFDHDDVIEIGMVMFHFDKAGTIYDVCDEYSGLSEPSQPLSEEIIALTGITDADLAGQLFDLETIAKQLDQVDLVIAHNAGFDRPFLESVHEGFAKKAWGCSFAQVPWRSFGMESAKLEYLAYRHGFFYEGHRATEDAYATLHLLASTQEGKTRLAPLLAEARQMGSRIWAYQAPFASKDQLKARGYRWHNGDDGRDKAWYIDTTQQEDELAFLNEQVYQGRGQAKVDDITPFNRFSTRI